MRGLTASLAVCLGAAVCASSPAADLTVYRCTATDGSVALQDSPCPREAQQEQRAMARPVDAPAVPPPAAVAPAVPPADRVAASTPPVERVEPQPLYECQRHDGSVYESDTGVPERRWVPLWVVGMDPRAPPQTFGRVGRPKPSPPRTQPGLSGTGGDPQLGPGAWVEDRCYRLPAAIVCQRRQARADELGRRSRSVGQSERAQLRSEQQGLREQLQRECG